MEKVTLETASLTLSAPTTDDVDAITAACQDPEIVRWTTVPSPYSRQNGEDFVRLVSEWWDDGSQAVWAMRAGSELVGMIGLHHIVGHPVGGHAELGYWVTASARGRGYVGEASRAVVDWGFDELGLARLHWQAVVGNIPSARTARALGFRYEGLQRQALTSSRGRDDGWIAGLLRSDDRTPVEWSILSD